MPDWRGSTRKATLPPDWPQRQLLVLERDRHKYQHIRTDTGAPCGRFANEVDHIGDRDDHSYGNLQALCHWHHLRKSGRPGGLAAQAKAATKPVFRHPGVL